MKRLFMTLALVAGSAGLFAMPAAAQVGVYVRVGPPAPRYERVPPPRPGWYWRSGYWDWNGGQWVWVPGVWLRARMGCVWIPAHWRNGYFREGHWRC